jgi:hypothetical protein
MNSHSPPYVSSAVNSDFQVAPLTDGEQAAAGFGLLQKLSEFFSNDE